MKITEPGVEVLTQPTYRHNAATIQTAIQESGGVRRAADIVEQAVVSGRAVLSN